MVPVSPSSYNLLQLLYAYSLMQAQDPCPIFKPLQESSESLRNVVGCSRLDNGSRRIISEEGSIRLKLKVLVWTAAVASKV